MKVLYSWIKEWIDIELSGGELGDFLDSLGIIEVEEKRDLGEGLRGKIVVGEVVKIEDHPRSRTLKIIEVNLGDGIVTAVSGAPNLRLHMKVAHAIPGAELPSGLKVGVRNILGVDSHGMPLSLEELGLEEKSEGILELPDDMEPGTSPLEYLGLDDWLYDLYIYPNRPDLMGVMGLAFEIRAHLGGEMHFPKVSIEEKKEIGIYPVEILDREGCPRYTARIVRGVKVGESPWWLRRRLQLIGQRPINSIVDISNYVLFELGHPTHVFDMDKLEGKIIVRRAGVGESLLTLDGERRALGGEVLVIADERRPVAIAGIIGGEETGVTEETENVLIESAYFSPSVISMGRRSLIIDTESSRRFERGADPHIPPLASARVAHMIQEISGGEVGMLNDLSYVSKEPKRVLLRLEYLKRLLGVNIKKEEVKDILERLDLKPEEVSEGKVVVTIPWRRRDLSIEADLAEEVARLHGYDKIEGRIESGGRFMGRRSDTKEEKISELLVSMGYYEIKTVEFIGKRELDLLQFPEDRAVRIKNPLGEPYSFMRPYLFITGLGPISINFKRGERSISFFEIGKAYIYRSDAQLPLERKKLSVLASGLMPGYWGEGERGIDYYDIKGVLDELSLEFEGNFMLRVEELPFLSVGAKVMKDGEEVGFIGEIDEALLHHFDIKESVFVLEIDLDTLKLKDKKYKPVPKFPPAKRDISLLVPKETEYVEIEELLTEFKKKLLHEFNVIDVYEGSPLPHGKKSITISLRFLDPERTLTDEEVDKIFNEIVERLRGRGYLIRGIDYAT